MSKPNYKEIYAKYHSSELAKKRRAQRNAARREAERKYGKAALKGKEVDHEHTNPGGLLSNNPKNLRVVPRKVNRSKDANSWRKTTKRNT